MTGYVGIIHKDKKSDYGVCFPDFPGCITAGKTTEDAHKMAKEALYFHIEGMLEDNEFIPEPMTMDEAWEHPFARNAVVFFKVEVDFPARSKRINIMLDENLIAQIDRVTNNRSAFLAQAARESLRHNKPQA